MFNLPDSWVWDFWFADDGDRYHVFFLYASRALHDPERRHLRASIGHAVSDDLVSWTRVADALVRSDAPAFDDVATWTGSVVRHDDGTWFLYYTGVRFEGGRNVQRLGYATSTDLTTWTKATDNPVVESDARWYERLDTSPWNEETWRDPWVLRDPNGDGWHILVTARSIDGESDTRGVVGHAVSPDLRTWEVRPPLSEPVGGGVRSARGHAGRRGRGQARAHLLVPASAGIRTASGRVPAWCDLGSPRRLAHRPVPDRRGVSPRR